jgi:hypothetical protein
MAREAHSITPYKVQGSRILQRPFGLVLLKGGCAMPPSGLSRAASTSTLSTVQRLFSMFPTGTAGAALFALRVSAAITLLVDGTTHGTLVTSFWILLIFALPAISLCLGILTPYFSVLCCLVQLLVALISDGRNGFHLGISILNSAIVAVLGPGAYSIDARLFGRRLVSVPSRK